MRGKNQDFFAGNNENRCFLAEKSFFLMKSICRPCFVCYILKWFHGNFRFCTLGKYGGKRILQIMSENTPKDSNGGVNDPVKLRNTDTATLKRIPVANPALASSAAKKTIKLKPLAPRSTPEVSEDPKLTETVPLGQAGSPTVKPASPSAPVPAPTILLTRAPKPAPASTPQFMSTATAPVSHVSRPPQVAPVPASSLGINEADTKTEIIEGDKFIATSTTSQPVERVKIKPSVFIKPISPSPEVSPSVPPAAAVAPAAPAVPQTPKYASTATTAVPSINLSKVAVPGGGAQPPKYVSTATGAIPPIKPGEGVPGGGAQPPKYVSTATGTIPPIKPGEGVPGGGAQPPKYVSTATGTIPPIKPGEGVPGGGAQPPKYVSTATAAVPSVKLKVQAGGNATGIQASQMSAATTAVPRPVSPIISPSAKTKLEPPISPDGTTTQGIQRQSQAIAAAKMQSGLQSAKPAIKLRPSAASSPTDEKLTPSSPTVRLQPKVDSAVAPLPPTDSRPIEVEQKAPPPPAAPPAGNTVTTKIPRSKVVLQKPTLSPSVAPANQPSLRQQGDIAAANLSSAGVAEAEQAIQLTLKKEDANAPQEAAAQAAVEEPIVSEEAVVEEKVAGKDEPNLFFAICAILAFLVVGYMVFALTAQYLTTWEKQQIPVVGFRELEQTLHKK